MQHRWVMCLSGRRGCLGGKQRPLAEAAHAIATYECHSRLSVCCKERALAKGEGQGFVLRSTAKQIGVGEPPLDTDQDGPKAPVASGCHAVLNVWLTIRTIARG